MKKIIALLNFIISITAIVAGLLVVLGLPGAFSDFSSEPEDLYILISLLLICISLVISSGLSGLYIWGKYKDGWLKPTKLLLTNILVAAILFCLSAIGFSSEEISTKELRLFIIPATRGAL